MARLGGSVKHAYYDRSVEVGKQPHLWVLFLGLLDCHSGFVDGHMVLWAVNVDILLNLDQRMSFVVKPCHNACLACRLHEEDTNLPKEIRRYPTILLM